LDGVLFNQVNNTVETRTLKNSLDTAWEIKRYVSFALECHSVAKHAQIEITKPSIADWHFERPPPLYDDGCNIETIVYRPQARQQQGG